MPVGLSPHRGQHDLFSSHADFALEKTKHRTDVRSASPPRYSSSRRCGHPYEGGAPCPHYSKETFDSEKRVHRTEIRSSPPRGRSKSPLNHRLPLDGPPYHLSRLEFEVEKSEHLTPILPVQEGRKPVERHPVTFRHTSQKQMAEEVPLCKTPLYPLHSKDLLGRRKSVVDNYLNYNPHQKGFVHTSLRLLKKEKAGHLTAINSKHDVRGEKPLPEPALSPMRNSNAGLSTEIRRHRAELQPSVSRSRTAEAPGRLYSSVERFSRDKARHRTPVNPEGESSPPPRPGDDQCVSHEQYSVQKRRHSVSPQPSPSRRREAEALLSSPTPPFKSPRDPHGLHVSNAAFGDEKRRHRTSVHNSLQRRARSAEPPSGTPRFTSRQELERAKRGHKVSVGAGGGAGGDVGVQVEVSNERFGHNKRGHRTPIRNRYDGVERPPPPAPPPPFQSHARLADVKRLHGTDIGSPTRSRSWSRDPSLDPYTSQSRFSSDKARHTAVVDSPLRSRSRERGHATPETPPSFQSEHFSRCPSSGSRTEVPPSHASVRTSPFP